MSGAIQLPEPGMLEKFFNFFGDNPNYSSTEQKVRRTFLSILIIGGAVLLFALGMQMGLIKLSDPSIASFALTAAVFGIGAFGLKILMENFIKDPKTLNSIKKISMFLLPLLLFAAGTGFMLPSIHQGFMQAMNSPFLNYGVAFTVAGLGTLLCVTLPALKTQKTAVFV